MSAFAVAIGGKADIDPRHEGRVEAIRGSAFVTVKWSYTALRPHFELKQMTKEIPANDAASRGRLRVLVQLFDGPVAIGGARAALQRATI